MRAAVIHSTSIVSIDALIDLRSALAATGQPTTGLVEGTEPINSYLGQINVRQTAWVDPARDSLIKSTTVGAFAVFLTRVGGGGAGSPASQRVAYTGTIAIDLQPI